MEQIVFRNEFVPDEKAAIKSILDYEIDIMDIKPEETHYMALGMNYSVAGFELILTRKMSFYIVTYYLPSGLFVVVSWISFLVNPEVIPGRMTLLVTIFLVLINIFNTIQTNSPKAEGLTAIEAWVIACIIFVFGALGEYTVILLKIKLKKVRTSIIKRNYIIIDKTSNEIYHLIFTIISSAISTSKKNQKWTYGTNSSSYGKCSSISSHDTFNDPLKIRRSYKSTIENIYGKL